MSLEQISVQKQETVASSLQILEAKSTEDILLEITKSRIRHLDSSSRIADRIESLNESMRELVERVFACPERAQSTDRKKLAANITELLVQTMLVGAVQGLSNEDILASLAKEKQRSISQGFKLEKSRKVNSEISHCIDCGFEQLEDFSKCPRCDSASVVIVSRANLEEKPDVPINLDPPSDDRCTSRLDSPLSLQLTCPECGLLYSELKQFISHKHSHFSEKKIRMKRMRGPKIIFDYKYLRGLPAGTLPDCHVCNQPVGFPHFNKLTWPRALRYHIDCAMKAGFDLSEAF